MIGYIVSSLKLLVTVYSTTFFQSQPTAKIDHLILLRAPVIIVVPPLHIRQALFMIDIMLKNVLQLPGMSTDGFELLRLLTLHDA